MLSFAILELLHRKPLSGYDLRKRFSGSITFFWKAGHSQIYPELKRMEREHLVVSRRVTHPYRPAKKVYAITPEGEEALRQWLGEAPALQPIKDEMLLKCFAFHLLEPEQADQQLAHHAELHERRLNHFLETRRWLTERHGPLPTTRDPIVFWNAMTLERVIEFERSYVEWCRSALTLHREFLARMTNGQAGADAGVGEQA